MLHLTAEASKRLEEVVPAPPRWPSPALRTSLRVLALPGRDQGFQLCLPCPPRFLERRVGVEGVMLWPSHPADCVGEPAGHVPDRPDIEHERVRARRHKFHVGVKLARLPDAFLSHHETGPR